MLAAPYILFVVGIVLILIAYFWGSITGASNTTWIDPRMSDDEIQQQLNKEEGSPIASLVFLAGLLAIFISIVWRLVRFFV